MEPMIIVVGLIVAAAAAYFFFNKKKSNKPEIAVVVPNEEETNMKKFALIVGINHYSTPGMDLAGCVTDANNIKKFLLDCCGFEEAGIRMLTDNQATKANILGHLEWLVSKGGDGVELFYYHSGHGTQVFDVHGDEDDQLDEVLVPYDHDWNDPLLDDYLAVIFAKLPANAFLSMICDTCHSGSISKDVVRNIAMPKEMAASMKDKHLKLRKFGMKKDISKSPQRHILLSGCMDNQTSSEAVISSVRQGAMTYNFLLESRKPAKSWKETHANMLKNLKASGWSQVPVLSGGDDLQNRIVLGREPGSVC